MPARRPSPARARITAPLVMGLVLATGLALLGAIGGTTTTRLTPTAATTNPVTPGDFRGLGFDQCNAPSQSAMDAWLASSPYLAVGIYISGNSRACRSQPNLTPTWVRTQLAKGWKLLPITLGPQASCNPRYPKYKDDPRINPAYDHGYGAAIAQAQAEAKKTVAAAAALGIVKGSTLWYDLEAFDVKRTGCRDSALAFLSAYTQSLHTAGYVSGVYSSAGSGMIALDDERTARRTSTYVSPDAIWLARWDGQANTSTSYISNNGWNPHRRVKQYLGGHNEKWGGVTINIDRDFLDLGRGAYAARQNVCAGVPLDFLKYPTLDPSYGAAALTAAAPQVKVLQCLLRRRHRYAGPLNGKYDAATIAAMHDWKTRNHITTADRNIFGYRSWATLLSAGGTATLKVGSLGAQVFHLQRALASVYANKVTVNGVFTHATEARVKAFQKRVGLPQTGIVTAATWAAFVQK